MKKPSLYIHIPFCRRECFYCGFTRLKYNENLADAYMDALCLELDLRGDRSREIGTVYFGGGSPAVTEDKLLEKVVQRMRKNFNTKEVVEMSVEINPEECTPEKLNYLRGLGFTRLSLGAQSFSDEDLRYLGRNHNGAEAEAGIYLAMGRGFDSVSADLIIGLPGQNRKTLKKNTAVLSGAGVHHISAYILEGVSDFHGRDVPTPEHQADMYHALQEELCAAGYTQYEVSNYCRDGLVSRHNMNYWKGGSYIGAGLSASGFEDGVDYKNHTDMDDYIAAVKNGDLPVESRITHDPVQRALVTGLRLTEGISREMLAGKAEPVRELKEEGFLEEDAGLIRVSPSKMSQLNDILTYLL